MHFSQCGLKYSDNLVHGDASAVELIVICAGPVMEFRCNMREKRPDIFPIYYKMSAIYRTGSPFCFYYFAESSRDISWSTIDFLHERLSVDINGNYNSNF